MEERIALIRREALESIEGAADAASLENLRVAILGKKGSLTEVLRGMGQVTAEERPRLGKLVNDVRDELTAQLDQRMAELSAAEEERRLVNEEIDITLPGRKSAIGLRHPLTIILDEIKDIFVSMGYAVAEGPQVELDYYNFEALNLPKDHPAREMHDSLYISSEVLLRTHTSPVQVRTMEAKRPQPIRIIAPGRVYRRDALDATHSPVFHQVEGLVVDRDITFADLKGTLEEFVHRMFGEERKLRFRPSYFPFTEPSAEVDMSCNLCGGRGCRVCKGSGWIEILGSGSVHPNVLAMSGYDPEEFSGFAFGMGVERIAMLRWDIDDIRLLLENDLRFLKQFRG